MNTILVTIDPDCLAEGADVLRAFAAFDARCDAEAHRLALRDAYWAAEDAANRLDATPEELAAWERAEAAYRAVCSCDPPPSPPRPSSPPSRSARFASLAPSPPPWARAR